MKNTLHSIGVRTYQALESAIASAYSQVSLKDIRALVCDAVAKPAHDSQGRSPKDSANPLGLIRATVSHQFEKRYIPLLSLSENFYHF